jgi:TonB family protein
VYWNYIAQQCPRNGIFDNVNSENMKMRLLLILFILAGTQILTAQEIKKKRGNVKLRDTEGRVYARGKVRNYKKHGVWKTFSPDGKVVEMQTWSNGVKQGPYILFYSTGTVQDSGAYQNDLKQGTWVTRNSNGSLAFLREYDAGKLSGKVCAYYPDGKQREVSFFKNDVALASRKWKADGRVDAVEYYCEGLACGKWTEYPEDCKQSPTDTTHRIVREYQEGKLNGITAEYRNGVLVSEAEYVNDLLNGKARTWNSSGVLLTESNYINGQAHGAQREYKSGVLISYSEYQRGAKQGRSSEYDLVGRVTIDRWYSHGFLDSAILYHSNRKRSSVAHYSLFEGESAIEIEGKHFEFDTTGRIVLQGSSVEHRKVGVWTSYYPNGKVNSTTTYSNGIPQGLYTRYYPDGKKMVQYNILPSGLNTPPDVWDEKGKKLLFGDSRYQELYDSSRPVESYNSGKPEELGLTREDTMKSSRRIEASDENVYETAEVMPEFPGGSAAMMQFIVKNVVYPQSSRERGEQGTVYVKFVVEKDGTVNLVSPRDGNFVYFDLMMEAIRVVRMFPAFTPGTIDGKSVRVQMVIPVKFTLQ